MKKILQRTVLLFVGGAAIISSAVPANARIFRDTQNSVYITDLTPDQQYSIEYPGMMRSRDVQANSCGWLVLRNSSTNPISGTIKVSGTEVDTATLPTQLLPDCNNGTPQEARTANFKTSSGDVIVVGRTANSYNTVETPQTRARSVRANSCGYIRLATSSAYQHTATTQIKDNIGAVYAIGQLTDGGAPRCANGTMMVPWNTYWRGS